MSSSQGDQQIAKTFDVTSKTIYNWRKRFGIQSFIKPNSGNRLYTIDHNFFETINTQEKAYTLGFLAADGYIHKSGKLISIALKHTDQDILERIKLHLGSNAPLFQKTCISGISKSLLTGVNFCSRKLVSDLNSYGIIPNKCHTFEYPLIPYSMDRHFIRGFFDGDGHIGARQFILVSNKNFLKGFLKICQKHLGITFNISVNNGYPRISGGKSLKSFLYWIYEDHTISLSRKHKLFLKYW